MRVGAAALGVTVVLVTIGPIRPLAQIRFSDVSARAGVNIHRHYSSSFHSLGVNWIDVDNDGWPDLFAVGGDPDHPPHLLRNTGEGSFADADAWLPPLPRVEMSGSVFADFDNDGDTDIYVYTDNQAWSLFYQNRPDGPPNLLLRNLWTESGGRVPLDGPLFAEAAASAGVDDLAPEPFGRLPGMRSKAAAWLDYDRDGCVDLYVAHLVINAVGSLANRDRLLRNRCDGTFVESTAAAGLYPGANPADYRGALLVLGAHLNGDLWPDLYIDNVAGDFASPSSHRDQIYFNTGGAFVRVFEDWSWIGDDSQAGMGIDVADLDANGTWDIYISDLLGNTPLEERPWGNVLYLGLPLGTLSDNVAVRVGVNGDDSWGVNFMDADQDGWEDLYVATMAGAETDLFFHNLRDGTMVNIGVGLGINVGDGRGSAVADYDRDGDLDIAVVNQAGSLQLFRNDSAMPGGWLQLDLRGVASNRSAIGAVVKVTGAGHTQLRQVKGGSGGHSQSSLVIHVGLGALAQVAVEVYWPAGGVASWNRQPANQRLVLSEGAVCDGVPAGVTDCRESPPADLYIE